MNFWETMGAVFIAVLILVALFLVVTLVNDNDYNRFCESQGYATEIYTRGISYCIAFEDGILKRIGLVGYNKNDNRIVEQEFVLVGGE